MKSIVILSLPFFFFVHCDKLRDIGRKNMEKRMEGPKISEAELERWKEKLGIQEAEIYQLDEKIREMVKTTKQAGALSWKIAQAYMKVGSYEMSSAYYQKALEEQNSDQFNTANSRPELHSFESAIVFFDKALQFKNVDETLLFEAGLSYANASRDRGWDKTRRTIALNIFKGLMKINPDDLRYPYQIALIYFDSSMTEGRIEGVESDGYNDADKAMKILYSILREHEKQSELGETIPIRFTIANFLYRKGNVVEAEEQYLKIKSLLEQFHEEGKITSLEKSTQYQNAIKNISQIQEKKPIEEK